MLSYLLSIFNVHYIIWLIIRNGNLRVLRMKINKSRKLIGNLRFFYILRFIHQKGWVESINLYLSCNNRRASIYRYCYVCIVGNAGVIFSMKINNQHRFSNRLGLIKQNHYYRTFWQFDIENLSQKGLLSPPFFSVQTYRVGALISGHFVSPFWN